MSNRILVGLAATLLVIFPGSSFADELVLTQESVASQEAVHAQDQNTLEMDRIQKVLTVINAEIKSDLDQLLALQEASKAGSRMTFLAQAEQGIASDPVNIVDVNAAQRKAVERSTAINARIDALLARIDELGAKKQQLLERFLELSVAPIVLPPQNR